MRPNITTCHPEKKHYSNGLCGACYKTSQRRLHPVEHKEYYRRNYNKPEGRERALMRAQKHRAKDYGLTWTEWLEIDAKKRTSDCEICGGPPSGTGCNKVLHIDHDHATGKFRGLLCHKCNTGLGSFKDNPSILTTAISYLRERRSI